jgi:hypothetical protein
MALMKTSCILKSACCVLCISLLTIQLAGATVTLSLNLRYTDPADMTEGGSWDLMAKTTGSFGISGITAVIDGIDLSGITLNTQIGGLPVASRQSGSVVEFTYLQDLSGTVPKRANVGRGGSTPGNVVKDDLFLGAANSYDNFARIASGSFGATRPSFTVYPEVGGSPTTVQEYTDATLTAFTPSDTNITLGGGDGVRGDSVALDGLLIGDSTRDGAVTNGDFTSFVNNFYEQNGGWDRGDFNDDGIASIFDYNAIINNFFQVTPSPALHAVPEPASAILVCAGLLFCCRRITR